MTANGPWWAVRYVDFLSSGRVIGAPYCTAHPQPVLLPWKSYISSAMHGGCNSYGAIWTWIQKWLPGSVLGNSGKPVTLETLSLTKFLRYVFQEQGIHDFRESGTCEASDLRTCEFRGSGIGEDPES
jgi:hypothetical protein